VKKNDIQKATFQRYLEASGIIRKLFGNIQLKDMNDIVVQRKIDEYAKKRSHSTTRSLLIKVKMALRDAYARGYLTNDFAELVKPRGKELSKRNKALSITDFQKLRTYLLAHTEEEFHVLVLVALETGIRRGELG